MSRNLFPELRFDGKPSPDTGLETITEIQQ